ncbi:hypothetical protein FRZ06_02935 [Anoxybacterium hadale]|uniref:Uncharacterized protein n=1 Tax=Anoxybacterium hadale TaxID=3408580 RepID=A0ACD1A7F6_9FIRM|nr:hypothetical protein FRZ06_02935 [Clostridiales bacterium]
MKTQTKNIVIVVLILIILSGGYWFWKTCSDYKHKVNDVLEYSAYSNLNITQQQLINLRDGIKTYEGQQISSEEFYNIIHGPCRDYFLYGDYTREFRYLNNKLSYLDYSALNTYIMLLNDKIPPESIDYHKENLMKIIKLWAPLNFYAMDSYLEPNEELKKLIEETNTLANEGIERIEDK